ncbi:hypothetical protein UlMin_014956 [Ulmus minor]
MGVHGLWELLAPVGRRVSVETLAGKRLAIDASIWLVQFMKAMRDEKGEMIRNAHLLGFFRRICKLLYLRTKPIFVFDGGTPALKRRTVIARRRQRENAQAKVRKTAEKLLLNHLKAMRLKELAEDIKNQRQKNDAKGKEVLPDQANLSGNNLTTDDVISTRNQEKLDELLAASIMAEEGGNLRNNATMSAAPDLRGEVDPAVVAAINPSMQHNLLIQKQEKIDAKGKKILLDRDDAFSRSFNQEKMDEMLAASLMAEENKSASNHASASAPSNSVQEDGYMDEDEDGDEEMILPTMDGEVDPSILAALPPSMQLDLLVQIRERLMAENRQKYQKVKKDPAKFSELQIQAYLKTVAFRREIDQVQKAAAGRGVGGVQTSRIASEANREFIFSSSFTGDKQELAAGKAENPGDKQQTLEEQSSSVMHAAASTSKSNTSTGSNPDVSRRVFDDNIETYIDERGQVRVSRVRAMGIRMTRDLQRNLDLMKEVEQERENSQFPNAENVLTQSSIVLPTTVSGKNNVLETHDKDVESSQLNNTDGESLLNNDDSIQIAFEDDDDIKCSDGDDIFSRLVAENPLIMPSELNNSPLRKMSSASDSDCDWEEGPIEAKQSYSDNVNLNINAPSVEGKISDDDEVDWEEGDCEITKNTPSSLSESGRVISRGYLEEEADLQEAIRRSLEDTEVHKSNYGLPEGDKLNVTGGKAGKDSGLLDQEKKINGPILPEDIGGLQIILTCKILDGVEKLDGACATSISKSIGSPMMLQSSVACGPDRLRRSTNTPHETYVDSLEQPMQDASKRANSPKKASYAESVTPPSNRPLESYLDSQQSMQDASKRANSSREVSTLSSICAEENAQTSDVLAGNVPDSNQIGNRKNNTEAWSSCPLVEITNLSVPSVEPGKDELIHDIDNAEKMVAKSSHENYLQESEHSLENSAIKDNKNLQFLVTEADLEEEMQMLGQEFVSLGDEQRRLERNAESVSSEMFTECQELLQMFGIPYIISPMEAEAQCAYMELANLVDGVVTDDSDAFLFGAQSVYKNIFDDRKYVETYFMKDIENELGLPREQLVRMALLLGSDYTEGISGIGIVNAIEVVNAFPEEDGLQKFRDWIESPDPSILGKLSQTESGANKKGSKVDDNISNMEVVSASHENNSGAQEQKSTNQTQDIKQIFMDKHRKVSKNWHIPPSFPSEVVISAYFFPQVDKSTEPFAWGKPDHLVLRKLCWEKFGWGNQKADELLLPVLKEYNKRETQLRLEAFYSFNERFAKIRSKRIKKAVKGITGNRSVELMDDDVQEVSKCKKKRKSGPDESGDDQLEKLPQDMEESVVTNQHSYKKKSAPKPSRKRLIPGEGVEPDSLATNKRSRVNHRGRGRGKGRVVGKGKGKEVLGSEVSETSSSDGDDDAEVHLENPKGSGEVRRSTRLRKPVDYTGNDSEVDDLDKSNTQMDKKWYDGKAPEQEPIWAQGIREEAASVLGQEKQHDAEKFSIGEELDGDYLEIGGGFCPEDDENNQPAAIHDGDPSLEGEVSEEYLKTGGGFCMDEDEDKDKECDHATAVVIENADLSHWSDQGRGDTNVSEKSTDNLKENDDQSKLGVSLKENATDESAVASTGALRAMPLLRRKRRKS